MYWEIEPYHNSDADVCTMPAENPDDHRKALEYAKDRLEELWDELGVEQNATVTIRLCEGELNHDI